MNFDVSDCEAAPLPPAPLAREVFVDEVTNLAEDLPPLTLEEACEHLHAAHALYKASLWGRPPRHDFDQRPEINVRERAAFWSPRVEQRAVDAEVTK